MRTAIVLPFFNEERRLRLDQLADLVADGSVLLMLVDDGSRDGTRDALERFASDAGSAAQVIALDHNRGKAEAVRIGLLRAVEYGAEVVGYADGDLSAPASEILRLARLLIADADLGAILGSRVRLADRHVLRRAGRHYIGRVIATYLDLRTSLAVYDTQCGAKFFRATAPLSLTLSQPFASRWLFDVELLYRLRAAHAAQGQRLRIREEPLEIWADDGDSRIQGLEILRIATDFLLLEKGLRWQPTSAPQIHLRT